MKSLAFEQPVLESMLAYQAITGCDTVSYLQGHSKKTSWNVFLHHHKLLRNFGKTEILPVDDAKMAEAFICRIYQVPYDCCDKGRVHLFCKCKPPEAWPPTTDAAQLHIQGANYRTLMWRQANFPMRILPSPTSSGWEFVDGTLKPLLTTLPSIPKTCSEIVFCRSTRSCFAKNCSYRKVNLPCCTACKCSEGQVVNCTNKKTG